MFLLNKGHQPGVYVPLRALFLAVSKIPLLKSETSSLLLCSVAVQSSLCWT